MELNLHCLLLSLILASSISALNNEGYVQPHDILRRLEVAHQGNKDLLSTLHHSPDQYTLMKEKYGYLATIAENIFKNGMPINSTCGHQLQYVGKSLSSFWAQEMIDAWAKPPEPGFLKGNSRWVGDYDECMGIQSVYNISVPENDFRGKYCTLSLEDDLPNQGKVTKIAIQMGACFPESCTNDEVAFVVNYGLQALLKAAHLNNLTEFKYPAASCQEHDKPLTTGAIATLVIYGIIICICITCTLYDYTLQWLERQKSAGMKYENHEYANGDAQPVSEHTPLIQSGHQKSTSSLGFMHKPLMCFSLYTNGCKLLSADQPSGSLRCVHGIRFLSMSWVILGHTLAICMGGIGNVLALYSVWVRRASFAVVLNATVCAVDSFFLLSGLLTTYLFLKNFERMNTSLFQFLISVPVMYLHRYIRLTPPYALMIIGYMFLTYYVVDGPYAPVDTVMDDNCKKNWWTNLLYLNNLIDPNKECAAWSWYLANDFQFFIVAPFIIYLMFRHAIAGITVAAVLVVISCVSATAASVQHKMTMGISQDPGWFGFYYVAPWTRYQTFGIGILYGYAVWKFNGSLRIPKWLNLLLWAVSAVLCLLPIYGPHDGEDLGHTPSIAESAIFNGWARSSWGIGLGWVVVACCTDNGGWVNEFLSWDGFVPLSRMSYCAYLIHPVVMDIVTLSYRKFFYMTILGYIGNFAMYMVLSYGLGFVFSLLFEAPFLNLDKHFITGKLTGNKKNN